MVKEVKKFLKEHKEGIKSGIILVLAPVAILGLASTKHLGNLTKMLKNASEELNNK
jgi:hypothetical protein